MGMVFCRCCGKEIHETAPVCPLCGAPQVGVPQPGAERSVGRLIGWGVIWTCVIWVGVLFAAGFVAGAMNPAEAETAGARIGELLAFPSLLGAILVSGVLTFFGKLPGTKKGAA